MSVAKRVEVLAQPLAEQLGLVLWDVRFFKEGTDWILLVTVDKNEGSVNLSDCENLSRAIDPILDQEDFIDHGYRLQVSSPGLERKLRTPAHFQAYIDERVIVRLQKSFEGQKEYRGTLASFEGDTLTINLDDVRSLSCTLKECAWVKADDF
ncbi:MAG: ribosome maturation factor RimP [Oscillospiraceae bacterium]|nr:ribosome maturation factor RimP [Oscillospiraceae bacterium]